MADKVIRAAATAVVLAAVAVSVTGSALDDNVRMGNGGNFRWSNMTNREPTDRNGDSANLRRTRGEEEGLTPVNMNMSE